MICSYFESLPFPVLIKKGLLIFVADDGTIYIEERQYVLYPVSFEYEHIYYISDEAVYDGMDGMVEAFGRNEGEHASAVWFGDNYNEYT